MFGAIRIQVSAHALSRRENWPSKPRSKRLTKKLTKKLGPQITYEPAAIETPFGMIVHPEVYRKLKERAKHDRT